MGTPARRPAWPSCEMSRLFQALPAAIPPTTGPAANANAKALLFRALAFETGVSYPACGRLTLCILPWLCSWVATEEQVDASDSVSPRAPRLGPW